MRPTPAETVAGVVRILRDTVSPAVADAHARGQLAQLIAVLGQLDWDDAGQRVERTAAATATVLEDCRAWVAADGARRAAFGSIAAAPAASSGSFAAGNAHLQELRGELERFIVTLRSWRADHGRESSEELLVRIGTFLADGTPASTP